MTAAVAGTTTLPAPGGNATATQDIVLTFEEAVQAGTGDVILSDAAGNARNIASSLVTYSGNTATINPQRAGCSCTVKFYQDQFSNCAQTLRFSTSTTGEWVSVGGGCANYCNSMGLEDSTCSCRAQLRYPSLSGVPAGEYSLLRDCKSGSAGAGCVQAAPQRWPPGYTGQYWDDVPYTAVKLWCPLNTNQTSLTEYTLTMASGVMQSASGQPFPALSYSFNILDRPPTITAYQGATDFFSASNVTLVLTFNENVQAGTGDIVLQPNPCKYVWGPLIENPAGNRWHACTPPGLESSAWPPTCVHESGTTVNISAASATYVGNTVTIHPTSVLSAGTYYELRMASGVILDANGNEFEVLASSHRPSLIDISLCVYRAFQARATRSGQTLLCLELSSFTPEIKPATPLCPLSTRWHQTVLIFFLFCV